MKAINSLLFFLLFSVLSFSQNKTLDYIGKYKSLAIEEMKLYNIPASIKLAQAILESASGTSKLSKNANNHFGIKCHNSWEGEKIFMDDDEKNECFRKYDSDIESYRDHSIFLSSRGRYSELFDNNDYKKWASGLKKAGYATNKEYDKLLIKLIKKYNLDDFDLKKRSFSFAYHYGFPFLAGYSANLFSGKYIYSLDLKTSFLFSQSSVKFKRKLMDKIYVSSSYGFLFYPIEGNSFFNQALIGCSYFNDLKNYMIDIEMMYTFDFKDNIRFLPNISLSFLI